MERISNSKLGDYDKDYVKLKFNSDDDIPLNKVFYFPTIIVVVRNIFKKDSKCYPHIFLDEYLYEI